MRNDEKPYSCCCCKARFHTAEARDSHLERCRRHNKDIFKKNPERIIVNTSYVLISPDRHGTLLQGEREITSIGNYAGTAHHDSSTLRGQEIQISERICR